MTTLLRTTALAVAAIATAWLLAAQLGHPDGQPRPGAAPAATTSTAPAAPSTALPWGSSHQVGTGRLHEAYLHRLEVSLTRLYALGGGGRSVL